MFVADDDMVFNGDVQEIAGGDGSRSGRGSSSLVYRIPAICTVKLSDGTDILLQSRLPIYQFGVDKTFPLK